MKKKKNLMILMFLSYSIAFVSSVISMVLFILNQEISGNVGKIITVITLAVFSLGIILMGLFFRKEKIRLLLMIISIIITIFSTIQIILNLPKEEAVLNFVGKDIKDLVNWADDHNIIVEQYFQYDDEIPKYEIISQDIKAGTNVKKVKKIVVTVSEGIDEAKKAEVDNMIGWKLDDVIKYIDENHLTNVTILFEYNNQVAKDVIFGQDIVKEMKRNEAITLKSSLGKKGSLSNVTMKKLTGMDIFHAMVYLGRNDLKYEIINVYNKDKEEGTVLKQSVKQWQVIERENYDPIVLTVAKQKEITMIDLSKMSQNEIISWATNNRLKVQFSEQYDDTTKEGKVISYSPKKGNTVEIDDTIYVTISKGSLYMPKFTTVDEFKIWADEYHVSYSISYEYSSTIPSGNMISSSHQEKQIIKNSDTIKLVISQGGNTIVPNFINMTKEEATNSCEKNNVICKFINSNSNSNSKITKQSIEKGMTVPVGTTITLTFE